MCCSSICGKDPDDFFAYNTAKIVRVKDRRLGILRLAFLGAIFLYIVVFVLVLEKGYLKLEVPAGAVGVTLQKPNVTTRVAEFAYCNQSDLEYPNPEGPEFSKLRCEVWDEHEAWYPVDATNAMLVSTAFYDEVQVRQCTARDPDGCRDPWSDFGGSYSFLASIDDYTIRVKHNMQATQLFLATGNERFSKVGDNMRGKMLDLDGKLITEFERGMDIVTLSQFLNASGTSLDTISDAPGQGGSRNRPKRMAGLVLLVSINYDNRDDLDHPHYTYRVTRMIGSDYKIEQVLPANDSDTRTLRTRRGVKLVFAQTGTLGHGDFQTTLLQLVSALGLLSVATMVVEYLMLYFLPQKSVYEKYKFEDTIDFSELELQDSQPVQRWPGLEVRGSATPSPTELAERPAAIAYGATGEQTPLNPGDSSSPDHVFFSDKNVPLAQQPKN